MKEFNLDEYLKDPSQKVITRDGRQVRIICTDAKGDEPIVALLYNNIREEENVYTYNREGIFDQATASCLAFFFFPTLPHGWWNVYKDDNTRYIGDIYPSEKEAKENKGDDLYYVTTIKIEWEE